MTKKKEEVVNIETLEEALEVIEKLQAANQEFTESTKALIEENEGLKADLNLADKTIGDLKKDFEALDTQTEDVDSVVMELRKKVDSFEKFPDRDALEAEIARLNNRLARAKSKGAPSGMQRG